jgi:archaellum component FlaC
MNKTLPELFADEREICLDIHELEHQIGKKLTLLDAVQKELKERGGYHPDAHGIRKARK